eukprot:7848793-Lingulodinium_polyedra.AAC.1
MAGGRALVGLVTASRRAAAQVLGVHSLTLAPICFPVVGRAHPQVHVQGVARSLLWGCCS